MITEYSCEVPDWNEQESERMFVDEYKAIGAVSEIGCKVMPRINMLDDGCWYWTGSYTNGRPQYPSGGSAYRIIFSLYYGYVADVCRHLCGNSDCVNPDHLCSGTVLDNAFDTLFHEYLKECGFSKPYPLALRDWNFSTDQINGELLYRIWKDSQYG